MKAQDLIAKALQAAASANILLDSGDADGACNRAYYAMFDGARAVLLALGHELGKTHNGVLNAFSQHLVKTGLLNKDVGRLLKHAETFRYVADYDGGSVELSDACTMVQQAQIFLTAIETLLLENDSSLDGAELS